MQELIEEEKNPADVRYLTGLFFPSRIALYSNLPISQKKALMSQYKKPLSL